MSIVQNSYIDKLPNDVLYLILDRLSLPDVYSFWRTSKKMHQMVVLFGVNRENQFIDKLIKQLDKEKHSKQIKMFQDLQSSLTPPKLLTDLRKAITSMKSNITNIFNRLSGIDAIRLKKIQGPVFFRDLMTKKERVLGLIVQGDMGKAKEVTPTIKKADEQARAHYYICKELMTKEGRNRAVTYAKSLPNPDIRDYIFGKMVAKLAKGKKIVEARVVLSEIQGEAARATAKQHIDNYTATKSINQG